MTYPIGENDSERVQFLHDLSILDTAADENLDRVTRLCQLIFNVPISVVSLIDEERQWFKSFQGLDVCETDREDAFCNYTILSSDLFEITDPTTHPNFSDNALVTGAPFIRYYAGQPLTYNGFVIGALCLIGTEHRAPLDQRERQIMRELAENVIHEMKATRLLRKSLAQLIKNTAP